jgi:hypothetical protein
MAMECRMRTNGKVLIHVFGTIFLGSNDGIKGWFFIPSFA